MENHNAVGTFYHNNVNYRVNYDWNKKKTVSNSNNHQPSII